MRNAKVIGLLFLIGCVIASCWQEGDATGRYFHKDLSEQMDALAVYQDAMGVEIRSGRLSEAGWLVDGLDSVLLLITERLNNHHNLLKPFETYYQKKLQQPIAELRDAIDDGDTARAHDRYKLLVNRCNSCHKEHNVLEKAHY